MPTPFRGQIETPHGPLVFGGRTLVCGILNVTPDSFSDGGRYVEPPAAVAHARRMAADGADLIDVGGESTRPGSDAVPADEQIGRVVPIIEAIRRAGITRPVSIDTRLASVAGAALDAGADLVNDVSALQDDPTLAELVARRSVPIVLMHMLGTPKTMQADPRYGDVVGEIRAFLARRIEAAVAAGIARERIIVDPGIGFGKTAAHNWELLARVAELHALGRPVFIGTSRKRFLSPGDGTDDPAARLMPTAATVAACALAGVQIVRVHDVREMRHVVDACHAIARAGRPCG
ncbi:MAG: dihydropteroate synthase [Phycisphaerae bacterium]|nr:dihydropteroate synthase [Phycisphaerae bacterium]